jgi:hypothetical protein
MLRVVGCRVLRHFCDTRQSPSRFKALNMDTGQNPRRHVVLKKASQMSTICTQIWKESFPLVYVLMSASLLGWEVIVDMFFQLLN